MMSYIKAVIYNLRIFRHWRLSKTAKTADARLAHLRTAHALVTVLVRAHRGHVLSGMRFRLANKAYYAALIRGERFI